jgi:hypothetical protein
MGGRRRDLLPGQAGRLRLPAGRRRGRVDRSRRRCRHRSAAVSPILRGMMLTDAARSGCDTGLRAATVREPRYGVCCGGRRRRSPGATSPLIWRPGTAPPRSMRLRDPMGTPSNSTFPQPPSAAASEPPQRGPARALCAAPRRGMPRRLAALLSPLAHNPLIADSARHRDRPTLVVCPVPVAIQPTDFEHPEQVIEQSLGGASKHPIVLEAARGLPTTSSGRFTYRTTHACSAGVDRRAPRPPAAVDTISSRATPSGRSCFPNPRCSPQSTPK